MINSFCKQLSNGYSFSLDPKSKDITIAPCCFFDSHRITLDGDHLHNRKEKFESISGWTDACKSCRVIEDAGHQSLRQTSDDWIPHGIDPQAAAMIDINLDTECNAACVICNEDSSSLWAKEKYKFQGIPIISRHSEHMIDQKIQSIVDHVPLHQLKYVKFFGGEPLFTNTHIKFLKQIPNPQDVTIHYTTNASILPSKEVLALWNNFKTVIFAASLDGIEKQFDYTRWPLSWSKVSQTLIKLKQMNLHNLMFRVEFTANILNTFYYDRLQQWIVENFQSNLSGDPTEINIHHCFKSSFALDKMPMDLRYLIQEKYPNHHPLHLITKNLPHPPEKIDDFWHFVESWDNRRKLFWKDCFPDIVKFIPNK